MLGGESVDSGIPPARRCSSQRPFFGWCIPQNKSTNSFFAWCNGRRIVVGGACGLQKSTFSLVCWCNGCPLHQGAKEIVDCFWWKHRHHNRRRPLHQQQTKTLIFVGGKQHPKDGRRLVRRRAEGIRCHRIHPQAGKVPHFFLLQNDQKWVTPVGG